MSKIKKLLLILICLLVSFEVGSESNNLDDENLYVIIVELEHNNKIYIKDATPFVTDCDEGINKEADLVSKNYDDQPPQLDRTYTEQYIYSNFLESPLTVKVLDNEEIVFADTSEFYVAEEEVIIMNDVQW